MKTNENFKYPNRKKLKATNKNSQLINKMRSSTSISEVLEDNEIRQKVKGNPYHFFSGAKNLNDKFTEG